jgi:hypothetical protein
MNYSKSPKTHDYRQKDVNFLCYSVDEIKRPYACRKILFLSSNLSFAKFMEPDILGNVNQELIGR